MARVNCKVTYTSRRTLPPRPVGTCRLAAPRTARHMNTQASRFPADSVVKRASRTIFSGIQPTGVPHIGNYLGALRNWVALQDAAHRDDTVIFSIVDLHAITVPQEAARLRRAKREMWASLLAIGLSPDRCIIYEQSTVPEHAELSWILSTLAPLGALNRMTQFKSKGRLTGNNTEALKGEDVDRVGAAAGSGAGGGADNLMLGLFAYPVLQAADILLYKTTLVPVGEDQSQHLELSRALARSLNHRMDGAGRDGDVFPMPRTLLSKSSARVCDLREPTKKMSKSSTNEKGRISILDEVEVIRKKINGALTDSLTGVTYDPIARPGVANLLDIYASFTDGVNDMEAVLANVKDLSHKALKDLVADAIVDELEPIRRRYCALDLDSEGGQRRLMEIGMQGTEKAQRIARRTMMQVRQQMGLL